MCIRFFLIFGILFSGFISQADTSCRSYYIGQARHAEKIGQIRALEGRLDAYFFNYRQSKEAVHAYGVFEKLKESKHDTNLEIFSVYLSVLENIYGSKKVQFDHSYDVAPWAELAKSDIFQERYWHWDRLYEYFFMAPLTIDLNRERDLAYLNHVAMTAKISREEKQSLKDVLHQANHTWAQNQLSRFPEVRAEYNDYQKNKSMGQLYADLVSEFTKWYSRPMDKSVRQKRWVQTIDILETLRNSNSAFDLFVARKYLEMITLYLPDSEPASFLRPRANMQMTDWDMHIVGLPLGSFEVLNDFLHQNSYDYINKAYTVSVLNTMKLISPRLSGKPRHNFPTAYSISRKIIDKKITLEPAKAGYQSDLHLYTQSSNPELHTHNSFKEAWVRWNPILGRPLVNTVSTYVPRNNHLALEDVLQLSHYMNDYFARARTAKAFRSEEIDVDQQKEMSANVYDSTYFISTHPNTYLLIAMTRLMNVTHTKSLVENEFPGVELPERKTGEEIREIGRLLATNAASGQSLRRIMSPVAQYLKFTNAKGVIYFTCGEAAKNLYTNFNAQIFRSPEQLKQSSGATPQWIMKYTVEDFIKEYLTPEYVTVQTRKKI